MRSGLLNKMEEKSKIFIGNLKNELDEDDLRRIFSQYGDIRSISLHLTKDKKLSFAFIEYSDYRSAILAVENFNGIDLHGHNIKVNFARENFSSDENKSKKDYTAMITKELFLNAKIRETEVTNLESKRRRTPEEIELLKKYKLGDISESEYTTLKKELKSKLHRNGK